MERFKRVFCIALTSIMVLSVCSCGKKGQGGDNQGNNTQIPNGEVTVEAGKDFIYNFSEINLGLDSEAGYDVAIRENGIIAKATIYEWPEGEPNDEGVMTPKSQEAEEIDAKKRVADIGDAVVEVEDFANGEGDVPGLPEVTASIKVFDFDKKILVDYSEYLGNSGYINQAEIDSDLNIYYILSSYDEETNVNLNTLVKISKDGEKLFEIPLGENVTQGEYWVNFMLVHDGSIICQTETGYDIFDGETGALVSDAKFGENQYYGKLLVLKDGKLATTFYGDKESLVYMDPKTAKAGEEIPFPGENIWSYDINAGSVHDFVLTAQDGVYAFNIGDTEKVKLMDYISSDLVCYGVGSVFEKDADSFYATYYDDDGVLTGLFTKVDPKDYVEKETLVLGCLYLNQDIRRDVVNFNKSQNKYKIVVKDYETENTSGDVDIRDTLNNDIMAGKQPDILMIPSYMDVTSYEAKGLFADIGELIDNDSSIKREDYLENVFKASSMGDKMYKIIPSFYIYTVAAKTSVVKDVESWTMKDFNDFMAKQKDGVTAFGKISKENFLWYSINFNSSTFADWQNYEAHFDSDEFINTLKYTDNLKADDDIEYDDDYWNSYDSMYRNGNAIFADFTMSGYGDYAREKQAIFGEDITLIGFPSEDGKGSVLGYDSAFYISEKTAEKEGAWEFVKTYLSDEKQKSEMLFGLPIKKSALLEKEKESTVGRTEYDEEGKEWPNTLDVYWTEDTMVQIKALSADEAKTVTDFIMSVERFQMWDSTIQDIITEEAKTYFSGQKKAEDVAGVIQNRVQTYMYEKQ